MRFDMAQYLQYLSNEELRKQMQSCGYPTVGPVTDKNRDLYIKKLQQILTAEPAYRHRLSRLSSEEDTDTESPFSNTRKKKKTFHYLTSSYSKKVPVSYDKSEPCILPGFRVPSVRTPRRNVHDKWSRDSRGRQRYLGLYDDNHSSEESDGQNKIQARVMPDKRSSYLRRPYYNQQESNIFVRVLRSAYVVLGNLLTALKRRFLKANNTVENNGFIQLPRSFHLEPDGNSLSENFLTTEERNWFSRHYQAVPKTLVWIMMLFFLSLTICYIVLIEVKSFHIKKGSNIPICQTNKTSERCVDKYGLQPAFDLIKAIHPLIEERSRKYACESLFGNVSSEAQPLMRSDLLIHLQEKHQNYTPSAIQNMETLISVNPHWGIALTTVDRDVMYLSSPLRAPLLCYVKYIIHVLLEWLMKIALWTVIVVGVFKLASAYNDYVKVYKQKVQAMVSRIHKFLRTEYYKNGEQPYTILIDDVYEELIPLNDRKHLGVVWSSAVKYIRHHDTHIKEEKIRINGELKSVWRWVSEPGTSSPDVSSLQENQMQENITQESTTQENFSSATDDTVNSDYRGDSPLQQTEPRGYNYRSSRIWQGQAFETMAGSPNSVPFSPTPCLKIRHMFDPDTEHGENWPDFIRDAVLEKCEGVTILHLYVDKTSREGCVYVKCRTPEDAGRAYCALHGWWFGNSHLVTVKYLRSERYHERFPEAKNAKIPLQPSGNRRVSPRK